MKRLFLAALLLACGGPTPVAPPDYTGGPIEPGASVSLAALVSTATGGAAVTWSMGSGATGSVSSSGVYTAPTCAQAIAAISPPPADISKVGLITVSDTVVATWSGGTIPITLAIAEKELAVSITPTNPTLGYGGTQQFEANIQYTCHTQVSP